MIADTKSSQIERQTNIHTNEYAHVHTLVPGLPVCVNTAYMSYTATAHSEIHIKEEKQK